MRTREGGRSGQGDGGREAGGGLHRFGPGGGRGRRFGRGPAGGAGGRVRWLGWSGGWLVGRVRSLAGDGRARWLGWTRGAEGSERVARGGRARRGWNRVRPAHDAGHEDAEEILGGERVTAQRPRQLVQRAGAQLQRERGGAKDGLGPPERRRHEPSAQVWVPGAAVLGVGRVSMAAVPPAPTVRRRGRRAGETDGQDGVEPREDARRYLWVGWGWVGEGGGQTEAVCVCVCVRACSRVSVCVRVCVRVYCAR